MSTTHLPRHTRTFFHGSLNLAQQKKRAKELIKAIGRGDPIAERRFAQNHPNWQQRAIGDAKLSDAQLVIARENGFPSWPKLHTHCETLALARQRITSGDPAGLDTARTLHIRCGTDIKHTLGVAGFRGAFLEFSDPYCQGPVPDVPSEKFREIRARFVSEAYDLYLKDAVARQRKAYAGLSRIHSFDSIALWFEHDSYDQLILAFLLDHLASCTRLPNVELITTDHVPGVPDFAGFGQLGPEALQWVWQHCRVPVTKDQFALGRAVWTALRRSDPAQLAHIRYEGTPAIPPMANALGRHLQELPSTFNGLSLTQQLALEIIAENTPLRAGKVFRILMTEREPLPFLGDAMFWHVICDLNRVSEPLIQLETGQDHEPWPHHILSITPAGKRIIKGEIDFLSLYRSERWVGGVRIQSDQPCSRWDMDAGTIR